MRILAAVFALMMFATLAAPMTTAAAATSDTSAVLIDFGNGQVAWADVSVNPSMSAFNATQIATEQNGMVMNSSVFPWGVTVNSIDGIGINDSAGGYNSTTHEYWGFWIWNSSMGQWESSFIGASDVPADSAPAIAWGYYPWGVAPIATPDHRHPWRSYRGDNFNEGFAGHASPNNITLAWSKDLHNGAIDAPIVAANGFAYVVTSGVLNQTTFAYETNSSVFCLNTSNSNVVWREDIGSGYQIASPLLYGGMVIVPSADGRVYAFNAFTGADAWANPFDMNSGMVYGSPSAIAYGGMIYVASGTGKLFCLSSFGMQIWNASVAPSIYASSPAAKDARIYIGGEDGKVHAFDSLTGDMLWNVSVGGKIRSSPLLMSSGIAITYVNYSGASPTTGGVAIISYAGEVRSFTQTGITSASAALTGSNIATSTSTQLYLLSASGQKIWNVSLGTTGAFPPSAPTAVDGTIFQVTDEANSRLMATSENGQIYLDYVLSPAEYAWTAPSVADGMLYTASDNGRVYAFDLSVVPPSPSTDFIVTLHSLNATFSTPSVPGSLFSYAWTFGDGGHASGLSAQHTYSTAGMYVVKLTVTSSSGAQLNLTKSVIVHAFTAPGNLEASPGIEKVTLSWTAPSDDGGSAIISYKVYRAVVGENPTLLATVPGSNLTYTDTACAVGTDYTYYVVALNGDGASPASTVASATPQPAAAADDSLLYVLVIVVVAAAIIAVAVLVAHGRKK
jgi:outer membrane protein assembly factor BamB